MSLQNAPLVLRFCRLLVYLPIAFGLAPASSAAPVVWSGLTFEFVKPDFAFPFPADQITPQVALTRGITQGPYNAAVEDAWNGSGPLDTRWATDLNNPGATIAAANHAALAFDSWLNAYGGLAQAGRNIVGRDAVLHLISDDIYLDIRFTAWTQGGGGGGFAYLRAEPPEVIPEPANASLVLFGLFTMAATAWRRGIVAKLRSAVIPRRTRLGIAWAVFLVLVAAYPTRAAFHLWHVKEVFSNADGSVQYIELFTSFANEQFVANHTLRANSDGVIKDFALPTNLPSSPSTANTHFLVATPGFGSLPGGVTPDFTLPDPTIAGPFFNPNAANITITFTGSNDSLTFSGSLLPKDGFHSLTDANATGFPPGTPNIQVTPNSPTSFPNNAGQIDLRAIPGDHNQDGTVDAADYPKWRKENPNDAQGYTDWRINFGRTASGNGTTTGQIGVPEPTCGVLLVSGLLAVRWFRRGRRGVTV